MPNFIHQVIQLTGPSETLKKINELRQPGEDFFQALVPTNTPNRGRFMPPQDRYSRNTNLQIQAWGSKSVDLLRYEPIVEGDQMLAIVLAASSAWDPITNFCLNIPHDDITAIIACNQDNPSHAVYIIKAGRVLQMFGLDQCALDHSESSQLDDTGSQDSSSSEGVDA